MTVIDNKKKDSSENKPENLTSTRKRTALSLDVDYYQSFLDDTDIPEDKKRELIETLWSIVVSFVDLGFGVHPVQLAKQAGDELMSGPFAKLIADIDQEKQENTSENRNKDTNHERLDT